MPVYWSILGATIFSMIFSRASKNSSYSLELNENVVPKNIVTFITVLFILFFCGFRDRCIDTGAYIFSYQQSPSGFSNFKSYVIDGGFSSIGFRFLQLIVKTIAPDNHYVWFFVVGSISMLCVYRGFKQFSVDLPFSLFLFVASATFVWMFNGIRQFLAVSILFGFSKYLVEGKKIKYLIVVIIAASIHISALLLIPICIIVSNKKVLDFRFVLVGLVISLLVMFSDSFLPFIAGLINKDYSETMMDASGSNIIRFFVSAVPVVISFISFRDTRKEASPAIILGINMSYMGAIFTLAASFSSGILVGRMPIYFTIYNYYVLPWLIRHKFNNAKQLVRLLCIILYLLYFTYQMQISWSGLEYRSDFLGLDY